MNFVLFLISNELLFYYYFQDLFSKLFITRFEQEIAGNLPPPPKMPKLPGFPPSFIGRPPMPPPFMNQKNGGRPPSQLAFPGPPPQMPPNMFGPPMGGLPPPSMQHGLPVPPPMMIPPPMPMPMPPMGMPQMQGGKQHKNIFKLLI